MLRWLLLVALPACTLPELPPPRNCETRTAFYPDEDGDGLGEATAMYLGCDAPPGWVTNADDPGPDGDTGGDSGDSGR